MGDRMIERRALLKGLFGLIAAPAIIPYQSLMSVKLIKPVLLRPVAWGMVGNIWRQVTLIDGLAYVNGVIVRPEVTIEATDAPQWTIKSGPREYAVPKWTSV